MYAFGHITEWQLEKAKEAYAETLSREPEQAPPTGAGELGRVEELSRARVPCRTVAVNSVLCLSSNAFRPSTHPIGHEHD